MARLDEYYSQQIQTRRINQTVASLEALGNHLGGIPGRKNLVWISGGVPLMTQGARDRWMNDYAPQVRAVAQRLATQGIAIYPVQASALQVGILGTTTSVGEGANRGQLAKLRPLTRENDLRIWATMDVLADVTGGRSFRNSNDLDCRSESRSDRHAWILFARLLCSRQHRQPLARVRHSRESSWRESSASKGIHGARTSQAAAELDAAEWQAAMQNPLGSTAIRLDARADLVPMD